MKQHHRIKGYVALGVIILAFVLLNFLFPGLKQLSSPEFVRDFLISLGWWSYIVYVGLVMLTIPLPIPSTPIVAGGGYVFGTFLGTVLSLIAGVLGGTIAFLLVRKYGKRVLEILVDKHHIEHFNHVFKKRGIVAALISYVIPIFPSDAVSLILGLTGISYLTFVTIFLLGNIPRLLIINSIGSNIFSGFTIETLIYLLIGAVLVIIAAFREKLKKVFFNELKFVKKEIRVIKKDIKIVEEDVDYIEEGLGIKRKNSKKVSKKKIKTNK